MSEKLKVFSPYDGRIISELDMDNDNLALKKLEVAYELASKIDKLIPLPERIAILEKTADLVENRLEDYAKQSANEGGKPLIDSRLEMARAIQGIREAARSVNHLIGREIPMGLTTSSLNRKAFTFREPIGVVVAVSAFNHPFNLIVHQVIPAVVVGCPVIIKPSLLTPISCINLINALYEAGLPEEWCQTLVCSNETAEKLIVDSRTAFFSFIGSAKVGWKLRSKLAPGARCGLEHGGAAPVIFDKDADIETALPLLAKGGFYHAGQVCVSVQRLYVHEKVASTLTSELIKLAEKMIIGDPLDDKTEIGPLISQVELDRVHEWVQEAKNAGAKILTGGEKIGETCYAPTIILNPPDSVRVSHNEIFGPVVVVYTYKDRKEAINRANNIPFSFQASVFTRNLDIAWDTVRRLNASAVMVNDHTAFRVDWMPFAGHKVSGLGVGGMVYTMEEMTEEKMVVFRSSVL